MLPFSKSDAKQIIICVWTCSFYCLIEHFHVHSYIVFMFNTRTRNEFTQSVWLWIKADVKFPKCKCLDLEIRMAFYLNEWLCCEWLLSIPAPAFHVHHHGDSSRLRFPRRPPLVAYAATALRAGETQYLQPSLRCFTGSCEWASSELSEGHRLSVSVKSFLTSTVSVTPQSLQERTNTNEIYPKSRLFLPESTSV